MAESIAPAVQPQPVGHTKWVVMTQRGEKPLHKWPYGKLLPGLLEADSSLGAEKHIITFTSNNPLLYTCCSSAALKQARSEMHEWEGLIAAGSTEISTPMRTV